MTHLLSSFGRHKSQVYPDGGSSGITKLLLRDPGAQRNSIRTQQSGGSGYLSWTGLETKGGKIMPC